MMFGLSITFGTLLGWHIYLMSCNMTTIEVSIQFQSRYATCLIFVVVDNNWNGSFPEL
jgi:hypothetical protein